MKRNLFLLLILTMVFALAACSNEIPAVQTTDELTTKEQTTATTELTVWGMTCNRCVNKVKKAVSTLDGVIDVSVDLRAERVTVEHEPELDIDTIKKSITAEGYTTP